ncbi:MAG: serine hydrolase [Cecembia sp.]
MLKKVLIALGIVIGFLALLAGIAIYYLKPDANRILGFIQQHPDQSAIMLYRNDSLLVSHNPNKVMPLASTVKIIVAIEYAEQSAQGTIIPNERISMTELEKFYVPNTDGGAHESWLESSKDKISDGKISIREIAKGMIAFSSNANTEWLMAKLGIESINERLDSLGLQNHTPIFYLVSSLFVGKELFPEKKGKELVKAFLDVSKEDYVKTTYKIHEKLKTDPEYKNDLGDLSLEVQKVWSDNLPASTVADYVSIMKKINGKSYFSSTVHRYLDEVMEFLMENPANQKWLMHSGMKGGSTASVLTKALYATDVKGNTTELAYFLNELDILEMTRLELSMNAFELKVLQDASFRDKLKEYINH